VPTRRLPRAVIALGWVSLLTDAASDMIYPLLPAFLMQLGGGATALGWIEGFGEATGAVLKLVSGRLSDRSKNRTRLVALGYGLSALMRPLYAFATLPWHAVAVRSADRVGKGLRGPPRDALLAAAVEAEARGHAFGFHRMMDNFGGVLGPVLAFALMRIWDWPLRSVFLVSIVPGLCSALVVLLAVRDPAAGAAPAEAAAAPAAPHAVAPMALSPRAKTYLVALAVFSLASSGDLFLVRRLTDLGLDASLIPIAWLSLQLFKGLFNVPGGKASDKFGRKPVLVIAWLLYGATYLAFGWVDTWIAAWALFVPYALHYGLAEGGQRALLAESVGPAERGRAFGIALAIEGAAVLPANVVFGMVYDQASAFLAFAGAAALALAAGAIVAALPRQAEPAR
jgi:MFS family permease